MLALVSALESVVAGISELTSEIRDALTDRAVGQTFRSLFKDPRSAITAAMMLAEIGDCRPRYAAKQALCADGGRSPSRSSPARANAPASAGPATTACATRPHPRRQLPPPQPLGQRHLPAGDRSRQDPPARDPDSRPRLARGDLALWQDHDVYDPARYTALHRLLATTA